MIQSQIDSLVAGAVERVPSSTVPPRAAWSSVVVNSEHPPVTAAAAVVETPGAIVVDVVGCDVVATTAGPFVVVSATRAGNVSTGVDDAEFEPDEQLPTSTTVINANATRPRSCMSAPSTTVADPSRRTDRHHPEFHRFVTDRIGEELSSGDRVASLRREHVDDLAELTDGVVAGTPNVGHLDRGFVDEPTATVHISPRAVASITIGVKCCTHSNSADADRPISGGQTRRRLLAPTASLMSRHRATQQHLATDVAARIRGRHAWGPRSGVAAAAAAEASVWLGQTGRLSNAPATATRSAPVTVAGSKIAG
jgi:hypothetical protein